jgi:subtilase family serine protease
MIKLNASLWDPEQAVIEPGPVPFYSGGGLSNVFSMPNYQRGALSYYFDKHMPPYTRPPSGFLSPYILLFLS